MPNDDTDSNESATVGAKDTYVFAEMAHNPASVFGVQINLNVAVSAFMLFEAQRCGSGAARRRLHPACWATPLIGPDSGNLAVHQMRRYSLRSGCSVAAAKKSKS